MPMLTMGMSQRCPAPQSVEKMKYSELSWLVQTCSLFRTKMTGVEFVVCYLKTGDHGQEGGLKYQLQHLSIQLSGRPFANQGFPWTKLKRLVQKKNPPMIEPRPPLNWSHPKATPRLPSSVESATKDWMAGMTLASPIPFSPLEIASFTTSRYQA